jgi:hypothetical protein
MFVIKLMVYYYKYMEGILYFVGIWATMRLHQSNQGHSMACLALIVCKYHVPYFFPWCNLQSMDSKKGLKAMFHCWHPPLCSCQLPVNIHTWWHVVRGKKRTDIQLLTALLYVAFDFGISLCLFGLIFT